MDLAGGLGGSLVFWGDLNLSEFSAALVDQLGEALRFEVLVAEHGAGRLSSRDTAYRDLSFDGLAALWANRERSIVHRLDQVEALSAAIARCRLRVLGLILINWHNRISRTNVLSESYRLPIISISA